MIKGTPNKLPMKNMIARSNNRVVVFIPVSVTTDKGEVIKGEIEDISLTGAYIRCSHALTPGETLKVELRFAGLRSALGSIVEVEEIDDKGLIQAKEVAEVRWQKNGTQLGVKFVNLSKETNRFLKQLVKFFDAMSK